MPRRSWYFSASTSDDVTFFDIEVDYLKTEETYIKTIEVEDRSNWELSSSKRRIPDGRVRNRYIS